MPDPARPDPAMPPVIPYLCVEDAKAAIAFYVQAFGAEQLHVLSGPTGQVIHAALAINGAMVMLADDFPEMCGGVPGTPDPARRPPVSIHLTVKDCDGVFARAIAAGATALMAPADMFWGDRFAKLADPFGHHWSVATPQRQVSPEEMQAAVTAMFQTKAPA